MDVSHETETAQTLWISSLGMYVALRERLGPGMGGYRLMMPDRVRREVEALEKSEVTPCETGYKP
jgi:hypothetical protein